MRNLNKIKRLTNKKIKRPFVFWACSFCFCLSWWSSSGVFLILRFSRPHSWCWCFIKSWKRLVNLKRVFCLLLSTVCLNLEWRLIWDRYFFEEHIVRTRRFSLRDGGMHSLVRLFYIRHRQWWLTVFWRFARVRVWPWPHRRSSFWGLSISSWLLTLNFLPLQSWCYKTKWL